MLVMLYEVTLTFESLDESQVVIIEMRVTDQYVHLVLFVSQCFTK